MKVKLHVEPQHFSCMEVLPSHPGIKREDLNSPGHQRNEGQTPGVSGHQGVQRDGDFAGVLSARQAAPHPSVGV